MCATSAMFCNSLCTARGTVSRDLRGMRGFRDDSLQNVVRLL
jgi:hypothetical protein